MMIDDGNGVQIDTDSRPIDIKQQLLNMQREAVQLEAVFKSREARNNRALRQKIRVTLDSLYASYKNLYKKYMREQSSAAPQKSKQGEAF